MNPSLLTCYTDILCLYCSNINNQELANVVVEAFKHLLSDIGGRFAGPEQWNDVIEQISLLFQMSMPSLLVDEMQNSQSEEINDTNKQLRTQALPDAK